MMLPICILRRFTWQHYCGCGSSWPFLSSPTTLAVLTLNLLRVKRPSRSKRSPARRKRRTGEQGCPLSHASARHRTRRRAKSFYDFQKATNESRRILWTAGRSCGEEVMSVCLNASPFLCLFTRRFRLRLVAAHMFC